MKPLNDGQRLLLTLLANNAAVGLSLDEIFVQARGHGLVINKEIVRTELQKFVVTDFVRSEQIGAEWRYFATEKGVKAARI